MVFSVKMTPLNTSETILPPPELKQRPHGSLIFVNIVGTDGHAGDSLLFRVVKKYAGAIVN